MQYIYLFFYQVGKLLIAYRKHSDLELSKW